MNTRDTLDTQLNVLENFNPIVPKEFKESEFLMLGNLMPSVQKKVLSQMTKKPKLIVLDTMNFWMDLFMDDLKEALKQVDVLTINDEEARQLSGEHSLVKAAKKILKMGPKNLVIKKGEHGALLFNNKEVFFAPALPLEEVFDPTGAGDSFAGGFIGYLAKTNDISFNNMKKAVIYGSTMASFCVEKFGTKKLNEITQKEVETRVNEFVQLVKFDTTL
jgi:sugar/nucleoside kinase (ribokinase family)